MMESVYKIKCPKCKEVELEFSFAGNNGYIAMCKVCKELMYYCSIFENITIFKATGEEIKLTGKEFYRYQVQENSNIPEPGELCPLCNEPVDNGKSHGSWCK